VTGSPVRPEVLTGQGDKAQAADRLHHWWRAGARQINQAVVAVLPWLLERATVVRQCGGLPSRELPVQAAALPTT
jgi:UDP-N-acetylglucosamine--N-acetylmuramyl-(pentapeptide) pyrophosphoryl-undecaprenol N-acetylglucosamine transferase